MRLLTTGFTSFPPTNQILTTIGLGRLSEDSKKYPDSLREVRLKNVPPSVCKNMFLPGWYDQDTMICASASGKDSCYGGKDCLDDTLGCFLGIAQQYVVLINVLAIFG